MSEQRFDAVVIGAGPGGYPAAIRLGQLGVKTAIVEREYMGGVCLNVGCIPSKAVIHAAKTFEKIGHADALGITVGKPTLDMAKLQSWKGGVVTKLTSGVRTLLKGNKVEIFDGNARLGKPGPDGHRITIETSKGPQTIIAKNVVLATGSRPFEIPGFKTDQQRILDSTGALALAQVPGRMVVIGGGYIGLELGMVYAKFGTKVTVVEALPSILASMDKDCTQVVARKLKKMGVEVMLKAKAKSWEDKGDRAVLTVELDGGQAATIDTDVILVSVGRRPNSEDLGLADAGVAIDKRGYVVADDQLRTNVAGIYALGDLIGGAMLAHKATKEGEVVARKLKKMGVEVMLNAKAKSWEDKGDRAVLTIELDGGQAATIDTDVILVSVGRRPNSEDLGLDAAGVALDKRGYVIADDHLRTNGGGIFAIGDLIGGMMLAHKATKEGEVVAEIIAGHKAAMDVRTIPAVVFTDPEIASAGLTDEEAKAKGHEVKVGKFPFAALGRALSVNDTEGFAKVVIDAKTEEILGVHIVGNGASDLISEAALAIEMGAVAQDLNLTIHPHPTLSEAVREAAAAALGEAIHIINR